MDPKDSPPILSPASSALSAKRDTLNLGGESTIPLSALKGHPAFCIIDDGTMCYDVNQQSLDVLRNQNERLYKAMGGPPEALLSTKDSTVLGAAETDGKDVLLGYPALSQMSPEDLGFTISHERGHIKHGDIARQQAILSRTGKKPSDAEIRKAEFAADREGACHVGKERTISSLKNMRDTRKGVSDSSESDHGSLKDRVDNLEKVYKNGAPKGCL